MGLRHPIVDSNQSHSFAHQYTKIALFNQKHFVSFSFVTLIQANACDASELHLPVELPQHHYGANLETWPSPISRGCRANTPTCCSCIWHHNVCASLMESPDMIFNFCLWVCMTNRCRLIAEFTSLVFVLWLKASGLCVCQCVCSRLVVR